MDMEQLISLESRRPPQGIYDGSDPPNSLSHGNSFDPLALGGELSQHPDQSSVSYIINDLKCGFHCLPLPH